METASYSNNMVYCSAATPTLICTTEDTNSGIILQNCGAETVFIGGPDVTTVGGASVGFQLEANQVITIPTNGGVHQEIYGLAASGSQPVQYLFANLS